MLRRSDAEMRPQVDRAGPADLVMLALDRGPVPEQVGAALLLRPGARFDLRAAEAVLAERTARVPRLRQRLVPAPPGCGRPIWVDDDAYDVARHVRRVRCGAPGDERVLLDVLVGLVGERLPRSRPLWSAAFVTGLAEDRVGLVLVLHHVLADGLGGLAVLDALVDGAPARPAAPFPRRPPSTARLALDAALARLRGLTRLPALRRRARTVVAAAGGLRPGRAARCSLLAATGPRRRLEVVRIDLDRVRAAAHRHVVTINDVVLAAVAAALDAVLDRRGESVDDLVVSVPVATRRTATTDLLGNRVGLMLVAVPAAGTPAQRLRRVAAATRAQKAAATEPVPAVMAGPVFRQAARLGLVHAYMNRQRQLHTLVTNLRGPDRTLSFAGAPVESIVPVALGDTGNVTVSFDVMSYAGTLSTTVVADPDRVPDLTGLATALRTELEALTADPFAARTTAGP